MAVGLDARHDDAPRRRAGLCGPRNDEPAIGLHGKCLGFVEARNPNHGSHAPALAEAGVKDAAGLVADEGDPVQIVGR